MKRERIKEVKGPELPFLKNPNYFSRKKFLSMTLGVYFGKKIFLSYYFFFLGQEKHQK